MTGARSYQKSSGFFAPGKACDSVFERLGIESAGIGEIARQAGNTRVIWTWAFTSCKACSRAA